jgi:hypothetical protein
MKEYTNRKEMRIFLNCGPQTVFLSICGPHKGLSLTTWSTRSMGVRRLFTRWGARTYFLSKKHTIFLKKVTKNYFWPALAGQGGGARAPLTPSGRP